MNNTHSAPKGARTPWQVTRSVWYAMFMREALSRTMGDRMGWFWMIFEPVAFTVVMVGIRAFLPTDGLIQNADFIPWLLSGLMGFFLVREGMMRGMGAINANRALFAYRQVHPIDPVLVRVFLEGSLRSFIFIMFIVGGYLVSIDLYPDNALMSMFAWLSLWCLGLSLGLVMSVAATLVPEVSKIVNVVSLPLLIISGAMLPLNQLPHWLLGYLMLNPIPHGLETLREGFFSGYNPVYGTSMIYFWINTVSLLCLGLLMQLRFFQRLKAK